MIDPDSVELHGIVAMVYDKHRERDTVSPSWLATEVMVEIAFPRDLHPVGYLGCHLQVRQIARAFCRRKYEPLDEQDDLFSGALQHRYPKAGSDRDNPEYILLDSLTERDVDFNVGRLRSEAAAKLAHADALEAWGRSRRAIG